MSSRIKDLLRRRVSTPLMQLLKQGLTPRKLALSVSLGAVIGCFPIWGFTTLMCIVVAAVLRLNQAAIQVGNFVVYPLQIALIIPFVRMGGWLFGSPPVSLDPALMKDHFRVDAWGFFGSYGGALLEGAAAWLLVAPAVVALLSWGLIPVFKRMRARRGDVDS